MSILIFSAAATARPSQTETIEAIIDAYCSEVAQNVSRHGDEIIEATEMILQCPVDLEECFLEDARSRYHHSNCIADYSSCVSHNRRDQLQSCKSFLNEFRKDTSDATRAARRNRVTELWTYWLANEARTECLSEPIALAEVCATTELP
jgi:hypothetical protein